MANTTDQLAEQIGYLLFALDRVAGGDCPARRGTDLCVAGLGHAGQHHVTLPEADDAHTAPDLTGCFWDGPRVMPPTV